MAEVDFIKYELQQNPELIPFCDGDRAAQLGFQSAKEFAEEKIRRERAELDRRSGHDRPDLSLKEYLMLRCCQLAGLAFHGVQKSFGAAPDDLCLFGKTKHSTTLAMLCRDVTPESLIEHLEKHETKRANAAAAGR